MVSVNMLKKTLNHIYRKKNTVVLFPVSSHIQLLKDNYG